MQTKHESLGLLYFLWSAQTRPQVTSWLLGQAANLSCPTVCLELHQKSSAHRNKSLLALPGRALICISRVLSHFTDVGTEAQRPTIPSGVSWAAAGLGLLNLNLLCPNYC